MFCPYPLVGSPILKVITQLFPPTFTSKLAVPFPVGVPEISKVKVPFPLANIPAVSFAVKPVTPVEGIDCVLYPPLLPPVYASMLDTPFAGVSAISVPMLVAEPQFNSAILPGHIPPTAHVNSSSQIVKRWPFSRTKIYCIP